jgi:hypothetical protein
MRNIALGLSILAILMAAPALGQTSKSGSRADQDAIVITFKDGHQQSFALSDVAKIEFKTPSQIARSADRAVFAGRWKVGTGAGSSNFYITLEPDGTASKSMGKGHGRWVTVGDEARISWDDGWHDVIRRAGNHYEKAAYAPGKSFSDPPSNITSAENTEPL